MSEPNSRPSNRARSILIGVSWVPIALWFATRFALRGYDGWGAWAAAPMLLPAVFASIGLGSASALGALLSYRSTGRADRGLIGASLLSGSLILYLVVANLLR
ncbi:MAG: hypothetical protein OEN56_15360 [Gemmatimonadota bacterium]|nr:hypothetical protein [Gemmatimonadota bacterium]MDH3424223.1 hypothetical protein [Gemmatimonadota bacterium]